MLTKLRSTGMKMKAMKPRKRAKELIPFFFFFCCKPFVASFQMAYREPRATQATQRSRPAKRRIATKKETNSKEIWKKSVTEILLASYTRDK